MSKDKISDYSATANSNTDIAGINIDEGCAPSGINNAIRTLMKQLKDFQQGTNSDSFNGPVGTTTPAAGAFTTLSASSTVSGTGFSNYLASPPAIGGTAAAAGSFTNLSYTGTLTGGTGVVNLGSGQFYKDASGNVGIGTSSPTNIAGYKSVTVSSTTGGWLEVTNGTVRGALQNGSGDVTLETRSAHPLIFGINGSEKVRIDSSGNLLVNNTSGSVTGPGTGQAVIACSTSGKFALAITNTNASGAYGLGINSQTGENIYLYYQGTYKGLVSTSSGGTTYGTTSDYRLKEDVQPMQNALEKVIALKPCTYKWKEDGSDGQGFIAHELAEVCPQAVVGEKDAVDENGNIKPQNIDTSFLVATLTAAIQELKAELDAALADIATLKGQA